MQNTSRTLASQARRSTQAGQRRLDSLACQRRLDSLACQFGHVEHVVRWNGRADDPAAAAADLLAQATGTRPQDPLFAFAAYLLHLRARSERLVVVIDDLDAIPPRVARWLRGALDSSDGTLRALATVADDATAERATARLGLALVRPSRPAPAPTSRRLWWLGALSVALGAGGIVAALLAVLG